MDTDLGGNYTGWKKKIFTSSTVVERVQTREAKTAKT